MAWSICAVAPLAGAGIEMLFRALISPSPLSQGRELKLGIRRRLKAQLLSPLSQGRELK